MKKEEPVEDTEKEIEIVKQKAEGMQGMLDAFQVTNDTELDAVADKIKDVKTLKKFIDQKKKDYCDPAKAIIAKAREDFDPWIKKCENAEITLKQRAKTYMIQRDEERRKKEEKIAARVEKGTLKPETAVKKMESLPDAPKTVSTDKGSSLRMSKRTVATIEDPQGQKEIVKKVIDNLPSEVRNTIAPGDYWILDEVRLRRDALALHKANQPVPSGVKIGEETDLASL